MTISPTAFRSYRAVLKKPAAIYQNERFDPFSPTDSILRFDNIKKAGYKSEELVDGKKKGLFGGMFGK